MGARKKLLMANSSLADPGQDEPRLRKTGDGPWCWLSKVALDRIRDRFDSANVVTTAIAVYLALAEIASDAGNGTFETRHAWISQKCGVSVSTIKSRLEDLVEIGLVKFSTPALKAPSTYELLATTDSQPLANDSQTTQKSSEPPHLATLEEKKETKEKKEPDKKERGAHPKKGPSFSPPTIEQAKAYAITIALSALDAETFHDHFTSNGWRVGGKAPMKDWQSAMRNWQRRSNHGRNGTPNQTKPDQTKGGW